MLIRNDDGTYLAGPLDAIGVLYHTQTGRDGTFRREISPGEPFLVLVQELPGWEDRLAMAFGTIPSRMGQSPGRHPDRRPGGEGGGPDRARHRAGAVSLGGRRRSG